LVRAEAQISDLSSILGDLDPGKELKAMAKSKGIITQIKKPKTNDHSIYTTFVKRK